MIRLVARLAWRAQRHEPRLFAALAGGVAALLAPLLVLLGLKAGMIDPTLDRLRNDPRNRELVTLGNHAFETEWLAALARRPDVAFVAPRARSLAASAWLGAPDRPLKALRVELLPSGAGDPLLGDALMPDAVVLSAGAAERLGVGPGDRLVLWSARTLADRRERAERPVTVTAVLPAGLLARDTALVGVDLLLGVEDYQDGRSAGLAAVPGPRRVAGMRLYARDIADVAGLERWLAGAGVPTVTQAQQIEAALLLQRNLAAVAVALGASAAAGAALALGAILHAQMERQRRALATLRLLGLSAARLAWFPLLQGLAIAAAGVVLALLLYAGAAGAINALFGEPACRLPALQMLGAAAATLLVAGLAALATLPRVAAVAPAEGVRDA